MLNVYEELGETSRRQILSELRSGPKNVTEIVTATDLKQPNVSNHLARMRAKGIVKASKIGRQVYYSLASPEIEAVLHSVFDENVKPPSSLNFEELAKQFAKHAVQGDEAACGEIMDAAFRGNAGMLDIYQELIGPAMVHIGAWYKVEAIDVGQEHLASEIAQRMMARTVQIVGPARKHGKLVLLGCAPNGWHVIGLRMIADYMRFCGWRTLYLGANVPRRSFLTAVEQHRPSLVLLSCGATENVESTLQLLKDLRAGKSKRHPFHIGVGGYCVTPNPDPFQAAGADFTAPDLRTFATEIMPLLEKPGVLEENANGFPDR